MSGMCYSHLQSLSLHNTFSVRSSKSLSDLPALTSLKLNACSRVDDEFVRGLATSSSLKKLTLDYCFGVSGLSFGAIQKLNLTSLSMCVSNSNFPDDQKRLIPSIKLDGDFLGLTHRTHTPRHFKDSVHFRLLHGRTFVSSTLNTHSRAFQN